MNRKATVRRVAYYIKYADLYPESEQIAECCSTGGASLSEVRNPGNPWKRIKYSWKVIIEIEIVGKIFMTYFIHKCIHHTNMHTQLITSLLTLRI